MRPILHRVFLLLLAGVALASAADPRPAFPLKVSLDHRYLTDRAGAPFLIVGDTAWSLIAQLDPPDVAKYLEDRRQKGFNAIIVNLIEAKFASHAPNTRAGIPPFLIPGDFSTPNPAYFDWAHDCLAAANARGIAVFLCPAYLGWGGGDEGFHKVITNQPAARLRGYGRFVAQRFRDLPNLVWMPGGDYSMPEPERWTVHALAAGIREADTTNLLVPEPAAGTNHIAAASKPDGRLAVVYLPAARGFTVDLTKLESPIAARWFDPTDGKLQPVAGSPFANDGSREFTPPPRNAAGEADWVLLLEKTAGNP